MAKRQINFSIEDDIWWDLQRNIPTGERTKVIEELLKSYFNQEKKPTLHTQELLNKIKKTEDDLRKSKEQLSEYRILLDKSEKEDAKEKQKEWERVHEQHESIKANMDLFDKMRGDL